MEIFAMLVWLRYKKKLKGMCVLLSRENKDLKDSYTWDRSKLADYLLYGTWRPYNAWRVLAGLEYPDPDPEV